MAGAFRLSLCLLALLTGAVRSQLNTQWEWRAYFLSNGVYVPALAPGGTYTLIAAPHRISSLTESFVLGAAVVATAETCALSGQLRAVGIVPSLVDFPVVRAGQQPGPTPRARTLSLSAGSLGALPPSA